MATDNPSPHGETLELDYKGKSIRALMIEGVPWYCLNDIVSALGWREETMAAVDSPSFPSWLKATAGESHDPLAIDASPDMVLLSPVGVFYWGDLVDRFDTQGITAWAKRESRRLCPKPTPGDPAMFLTLTQGSDGWV